MYKSDNKTRNTDVITLETKRQVQHADVKVTYTVADDVSLTLGGSSLLSTLETDFLNGLRARSVDNDDARYFAPRCKRRHDDVIKLVKTASAIKPETLWLQRRVASYPQAGVWIVLF